MIADLSGRTLGLSDVKKALKEAEEALLEARATCRLLRDGDVVVPAAHGDLNYAPTPEEVRLWQDLVLNEELRRAAKDRDREAMRRESAGLAPARWRISRFLPNGYFQTNPEGMDADPGGPGHHSWVPVPEAVDNLLRQWSVPAGRPVEVVWECEPCQPTWLWPIGGGLPGHRGNAPGVNQRAVVNITEAWERDSTAHRARFAELVRHVRRHWPHGVSVDVYLAEAAAKLNADHPQPPEYGQLLGSQRSDRGLINLGYGVTTAWIDPAAVAYADPNAWGDFSTHRPGTPPARVGRGPATISRVAR